MNWRQFLAGACFAFAIVRGGNGEWWRFAAGMFFSSCLIITGWTQDEKRGAPRASEGGEG